jgi:tRNA (mo5U34)-methyltransferase
MDPVTQEAVDALQWFHSIELGNGVVTKGRKSAEKLREQADIIFRHGISGKSVLDIGAWDGGFSFEAERRGAARVVAADYYSWNGSHWGSKNGFLLARQALNSRVEDYLLDIEHANPDGSEKFDTVLLLGVIYHLKSPFYAIEHAAKFARETLVVETVTGMNRVDEPVMRFFPHNAANNWWRPNIACVKEMVYAAGFEVTDVSATPGAPARPGLGRFVFHATRRDESPITRRPSSIRHAAPDRPGRAGDR